MFKRRDRRPLWKTLWHLVWPKGGWVRAFEYVKHRIRRLPDTPEKIARGLAAGVFTGFVPLYGLHFVIAWLLAIVVRGNVLASLLGTFVFNPLTTVPIAVSSLWVGHRLLGRQGGGNMMEPIGHMFDGAMGDLWHNFIALFTTERMEWGRLARFFDDVYLPFLVGSILPGLAAAVVSYFAILPLLTVYQNSRRKKLRSRLGQLSHPSEKMPDAD